MHQLQFLLHKQHLSLNGLCHDLLFHVVSLLKSSLSAFTPILCSKGVFTWYWGDLRAGMKSLQFPSWLLICLHDTTMKCHAGESHHDVTSLRLLYRRENFSRKVCENEIVPCENIIFKHISCISLCYKYLILSSIKIQHLHTLWKSKIWIIFRAVENNY